MSYYFLAQYDLVRQNLDRARTYAPSSARELFLYAMSYENEGNADETLKYLRQAIALEPSNGRFYCHLGVALLAKNEIEPAREAFTNAIRHKADFCLASLRVREGDGEGEEI